jgi:hypothetical protein
MPHQTHASTAPKSRHQASLTQLLPTYTIGLIYVLYKYWGTPLRMTPKRDDTRRSSNALIVKSLYCNIMQLILLSWMSAKTKCGTGFNIEFLVQTWPDNIMKQDRQCTYNLTLRRGRATTVAVKKQWVFHSYSVCVCSLRYPACNAHAPCFSLWPAPFYNTFSHYLTKGKIFEKKKQLNMKCVFRVSPQLFLKHFSF